MDQGASEKSSQATECPVCSEDYTDPKLLHCNHLVCRKCVMNWLEKTNRAGGCPLCRSPILPDSFSGQEDLQTLLDALPTDLTTVSLVEGSKILSGRNVCMQCSSNNSAAAASFCLQCRMKLCSSCTKGHKNIPMLKNHVIEELSDLTPERLAEINRSSCKNHDDRLTEMYCPAHQELICMICAKTTHWECVGVKTIESAAQTRRDELKEEARELRKKESTIKEKMKERNAMLTTMRQQTKDLFDALQAQVEKGREEVSAQIQAIEYQMALPQMEADRATVKSNADVIDSWVETAPDDALLEMTNKLRPRLNELKQRTAGVDKSSSKAEVIVDVQALSKLKSFLAGLWKVQRGDWTAARPSTNKARGVTSVGSNPKPTEKTSVEKSAGATGPPSVAVVPTALKIGDRVRRGPHWNSGNEDGRGLGKIIAIPSQIRAKQGCDSQHYVDVRWDNGREGCHRMGRYGCYDLELI